MNTLGILAFFALVIILCILAQILISHLERQIEGLKADADMLYRNVQALTEALCAANGNKVTLERKSERIEQLTKLADKAIVGVPYFAKGNGDAIMQSQIQTLEAERKSR